MAIPAHLSVYREPFAACPSMHTYTSHVSLLCQFQWDYILDWPSGEQPKIWIFAYRCYQRGDSDAEFQIVDNMPFDIPVWQDVVYQISRHAADELYKSAQIVGPIIPMTSDYPKGAEEAANKRYDMSKYRALVQGSQRSK